MGPPEGGKLVSPATMPPGTGPVKPERSAMDVEPTATRGGARKGAGRKPRPKGARKVGAVLSPAAALAWDAYEGDRSAWVSGLIEAAVERALLARQSDDASDDASA